MAVPPVENRKGAPVAEPPAPPSAATEDAEALRTGVADDMSGGVDIIVDRCRVSGYGTGVARANGGVAVEVTGIGAVDCV